MRSLFKFLRLGCVLAATVALATLRAAAADNIVARFHFAGAADLSRQTNLDSATKMLDRESSTTFKELVVRRFSEFLATGLPVSVHASGVPLEPLVTQVLNAETVAAFGGVAGQPLQFVMALRLPTQQAQLWDEALAKAIQSPGEKLDAAGAHGLQWPKGLASLWLLHDGDWLVVGRGNSFQATRDEFLAQIRKQNRPAPALSSNIFEADVDWAKLEQWLPVSLGALKPARTQIEIASSHDQIFHMTAHVIYPEAIQWKASPWNPPVKLISDPLISFTAARDIAPFLSQDVFAGLPDDPFPQQFYCWAKAYIPFQTYMAWPVADASNEVRRLSKVLPAALGPKVKALDDGSIQWNAKVDQIAWDAPNLRIAAPYLKPAESDGQSYLLASMFPADRKYVAPPPELFAQFNRRDDIVYYDWETTGRRLNHWRLLSEMLPVVHRMTPAEAVEERNAIKAASTAGPKAPKYRPSFAVVDNWLNDLAAHLTADTITEVAKTGPAELTIKRRAPFLFTSLELELLAHWMAHAPSIGHMDPQLLPRAKVTGPGIPTH